MVQISFLKRSLVPLLLLFCLTGHAGVTFRFAGGTIDKNSPKTKTMEGRISALLSEIDRAGRANTGLNLNGIVMEKNAKARLNALWDDAHFVCDKNVVISKCLNDFQGYQVRAIPITMRNTDATYKQSLKRELTVSLDRNGVITGARLAWEMHEDVSKLLSSPNGVADTRQRLEVLKWVEDFRCYYNERDIRSIEQVFSNDALIITGSVTTIRTNTGDQGPKLEQRVRYNVQDKEHYIKNLTAYFNNHRHLDVKFDHISVVRHGSKPNVYGVTLHQLWDADKYDSKAYKDDGWLFLLWDFSEPDKPEIEVRTWQPEQAVSKDGVFTLDDFKIP